jgi:hypothetical protein
MEGGLSCRNLEDLIEPSLEVLRWRRRPVEIDATPAEAVAEQFQLDVIIFGIRVGDANRFALTKREEPVTVMEHEDFSGPNVEVELPPTLCRRAHGKFAPF